MTKTTTTANERNYSVYLHLCKNTKEFYIGCSSRPYKRWHKNGQGYKNQSKMAEAINKYDWNSDAWVHTVVMDKLTRDEALELEHLLIVATDSVEHGLNTVYGDETICGLTEDVKRRISKGRTGQKWSDEVKAKISASRKEANGKKTRPVIALDRVTGEIVAEYPSAKVAEEKLRMRGVKVSKNNISSCCHGTMKSSGGFAWKFKEVTE